MQFVELYHLPHWLPALFFGGLAALPWVQWYRRFSLRAFLIVLTLVAVVLGLAVAFR